MRSVLLIVLMVCFFTVPSIAQTTYQRTPFCKNEKWGYVNEKEKVVIKAKYQEAGIFNNGYAIVKKDNKYGIIDYNGNETIPFSYDYIEIKWGGIYLVKLGDKYGLLSSNCSEIIPPKYDDIKRIGSNIYTTRLGYKYGVVSSIEKELIPPKFDNIKPLARGIYLTKYCGKYGILLSTGDEIIASKYDSIERLDSGIYLTLFEGKYGTLSSDCNEIVAPKYDNIEKLDSGNFLTELEEKYGFLSSNGNEIIAPKYDSIEKLDSGNFLTKLNGKYGFLSSNGNEIMAPKYDSIEELNSGNLLTKLNGKYGFLSSNGNEIMAPKYDSIEELNSGNLLTKLNGKYGFLSSNVWEIIAPKYDSIENLNSGDFITELEGKYGILSSNGWEIIAPKYDSIKKIKDVYITKQDDKYGFISSTYTEILSPCLLYLDLNILENSNSYQIVETSSGYYYIIQAWHSSVSITNVEQLSDYDLFYLLKTEQLSYNDISVSRLNKLYGLTGTYPREILEASSFQYNRMGYPNIEIEQNGNIYTYPSVFTCKDEADDIVFYNTNISPENAGMWSEVVHGAHYSTHHVTMNKIKIGEQTADILSCFSSLFENNGIQLISPTSYIKNPKHPNKLLLTTNVTYADKPSIIYTEPKYTVIAGQLIEVNSGINYHVPLYEVGHLCIINTSTMESDLIPLEGISYVSMKYDKLGEHIYLMNQSVYVDAKSPNNRDLTISQNQSPIYIATMDNSANGGIILNTAIVPKEGDVIIDIQSSLDGEYIYLCGSTTKQGYIGYENGIFIIFKKNNDTYEEVARYCGKNKNRYYNKITVLDDENVSLKYSHDIPMNAIGPDVLNIPSIINKQK